MAQMGRNGAGRWFLLTEILKILEDIFKSPFRPLVVVPAFQAISVRHFDSSKTLAISRSRLPTT